MSVWERIKDWWPARQRAIDLQILWPACKEGTSDLNYARAAFATHVFHDPAWLRLGEDKIIRIIGELT